MKTIRIVVNSVLVVSVATSANLLAAELTAQEQLGKSIFFDDNLSLNRNQSCAACHGPEAGWTGPDSTLNAAGAVYEGSVPGRFGNRKPPSSAYATPSPILHFVRDKKDILFIGGNFWDGRATGEKLGNPAADQAQGPFLNPLEQALPDNACVVYRVCTAPYPVTFEEVFPGACAIGWPADTELACSAGNSVNLSAADRIKADAVYDSIGLTVAAYEGSAEVNAFTSKYDYYLAGQAALTREERMGLALFKGKGKCANCHIIDPGPDGEPPLLTDFTFDNLGVPKNPDNPFYTQDPVFNPDGADWVDLGLGGFLATRPDYADYADDNEGKQKVPTLRNVDKRPYPGFVKSYAHNGYFKSLKEIVHFYNTRDVLPECDIDRARGQIEKVDCWPEPEVDENVNDSELGDLRLSDSQEDAIVAFMKTLSDGYVPPGAGAQ